eukprot:TRINITY_DN95938_c0_g1_i1.p1 TRINITY_DN95938_c0_g1~~TRINITY_DN95938_c0_g1_i1.p1  ORF type:complete len:336 (+),score=83.24 TRINITY_DN95938_c0_g1_i1:81-1088(+)
MLKQLQRSLRRSQSWRRRRVLQKRLWQRRRRSILATAWHKRRELWQLPGACRSMKDAHYWHAFFSKMVRKLELRLKAFSALARRGAPSSAPCSFEKVHCQVLQSKVLTEDEHRLVDDALHKQLLESRPDEVLCTRFGAELTRRHLSCLQPEEWLNDEVVNCYMRLLQEESEGRLWCPNTFFWPKLKDGGYSAVQRWSRRASIDLANVEAIIVPLHLDGCHWALAVVHIAERRLAYFDSLGLPPPEALQPRLAEFMQGEASSNAASSLHAGPWKINRPKHVAQEVSLQQNGSDCGVFMLAYAECIAAARPLCFETSPEVIVDKRRTVALAVLTGSL